MFKNYLNRLKVEFHGYNAQSLIKDLLAGLTVAAVALPLALAFGVSSGADAAAGLLTAIIAGFLIGGLSGASYQISGPTGAMSAILIGLSAHKIYTALVLLENGCDPFQMIDKKGNNGVTIALEQNNKDMISNIVKYAGNKTDVQGNTILHYAAKSCDFETVKFLISFGIDKNIKNVSGDTAYTIAKRWKKTQIADLLK